MAAVVLNNAVSAEFIPNLALIRFTNADKTTSDLPLPYRAGADGVTPVFVPGKYELLPAGSELRIVTRSAGRPNTYQIDIALPLAPGSGSGTPGPAGRGVVSITASTDGNGNAVFTTTYTDGSTTTATVALPPGPKGDPGTPASPTTAYADVSRSGVALPYARTQLERNRDGRLSIMNWIASTKRTDLMNGVWTGDVQPEIQNAMNSGENISVNVGTYPVLGPMAMPSNEVGQEFVGAGGRNDVIFRLPQGYPAGGSYVFKLNQYATFGRLTIDPYQPGRTSAAVPASGAIVRYPWLVDISGTTRGRIDDLTMGPGWDGIYAGGNAGGCNFSRIEDGTLNRGIYVENPLDFFTIETWESWPYLYAGTGLETWSYANPGTLQFLAADGLNCDNLVMWKKGIAVANASQLAATFGIVKLDGGNAFLKTTQGRIIVGQLNALTDAGYPPIENDGAVVVIGSLMAKMADAANDPQTALVKNTSGTMIISGGEIAHNSTYRSTEVNAGLLNVSNVLFSSPAAKNKPLGEVYQGGGRLMLKNCPFTDATGTGPAVYMTTNDVGHSVAGNYLGGRGIRQPAAPAGYFAGNPGGSMTTF